MSRYAKENIQPIYVPGLGIFTRTTSVTGEVTVAPVDISTVKDVGANIYEAQNNSGFIMRETGLSRVIDRNDRVIDALSEPAKYLADRNKRIIAMEDELNKSYSKEFSRALTLGYSDEDAKTRSMKLVNHLKETLLSDIDKDFPMEAIDLAKKRLLKKN